MEKTISISRHRVAILGCYSSDNVLGVLENMRAGMKIGVEVLAAGFAPFVPWFDYHFTLMRREGVEITIDDYYENTMAWLEVSECGLVISGEETSTGVMAELRRCKELGITVFHTLPEVVDHFKILDGYNSIKKEVDPWDEYRDTFWAYAGNAQDPDAWRCNLHSETFDISEGFCSRCQELVDDGWKASDIEKGSNLSRIGEEEIPDEVDDEEDEWGED